MDYFITIISLYVVYAVCRSQERRVVIWRTFWWMTDRAPAETKGAVFFDTPLRDEVIEKSADGSAAVIMGMDAGRASL